MPPDNIFKALLLEAGRIGMGAVLSAAESALEDVDARAGEVVRRVRRARKKIVERRRAIHPEPPDDDPDVNSDQEYPYPPRGRR